MRELADAQPVQDLAGLLACPIIVLLRAVEKTGRLIDFMLLDRRNTRAAHRFLGEALKTMRNWPPVSITTDKLDSYTKSIQRYGRLSDDVMHRTSKYLNNFIEADYRALKQVIRPAPGFQTMKKV